MYVYRVTESPGLELEQLVGRNLRLLREARRWPLREVAERMKAFGYTWHQTVVAKIETGHRPLRLSEASDLANLYETTLDDILGPLSPDAQLDAASLDKEIAEAQAALALATKEAAKVQWAHQVAGEAVASAAVREHDLARDLGHARANMQLAELRLRTLEGRRAKVAP
jgi:transcriptional regulator with XRE-family HTH domain